METGPTLRVLVVEDEPMIAMVVEEAIVMLGFQIIGPVAQVDEAMALTIAGNFDCGILDINIQGGKQLDASKNGVLAGRWPRSVALVAI